MNQAAQYGVQLRAVTETDLPIFFDFQLDEEANWMAAFTSEDPSNLDKFMAHWEKVLGNPANTNRTILFNGQVAGNIAQFEMFDEPEIGYWIDKTYWGKGIATQALTLFLEEIELRPLYARVAKDNQGSIRVLEKCGFIRHGEDKGFSNARGVEVEEYILMLR